MNERIRELERQAIEYANQQNTFDPRSEFSKKFAELIIGQCLNQCYNRGMNDALYAGQLQAAAYIEEHFGVKE